MLKRCLFILAIVLIACGHESSEKADNSVALKSVGSRPSPSVQSAPQPQLTQSNSMEESFEAPSKPFEDFPEEVASCTGPERPIRLYSPLPNFPPVRKGLTFPGKVVLESIIDKHGSIARVRVQTSFHPPFDQAAIDALKTWRFKPAILGNKPLNVYYILTVNFVLVPKSPILK